MPIGRICFIGHQDTILIKLIDELAWEGKSAATAVEETGPRNPVAQCVGETRWRNPAEFWVTSMGVQGHQAAAAGGGPGAGVQPKGSEMAELRRV